MYDYYWGLTIAQIELMSIDAPMVVYKREPKRDKNGKIIPKKAKAEDVLRSALAYKEKYKNKSNNNSFDLRGFSQR